MGIYARFFRRSPSGSDVVIESERGKNIILRPGGSSPAGTEKVVYSGGVQVYGIKMTDMYVHDAVMTPAVTTAGNDDAAIVGTGLSAAQTIQATDFGGTTADEKIGFNFVLPASYEAGDSVTVRLKNAGMLTTVSDGTATVDVVAFSDDGDGTISSDICATAAQSINSLTLATKDFVITPTALAAGMRIFFRIDFAGSDTGNLGVMIPTIGAVEVIIGL